MSNITGDRESFSSDNNTCGGGGGGEEVQQQLHGPPPATSQPPPPPPVKRKRNLPGTPDPTAEVIALSPATLVATNRFVCEVCSKGFQRDQNLQLHRRGHNLPWKLRRRTAAEARRRVYVCPEPGCVHHDPARALGDLTGIKKHFCRKHGEKRWGCDRCSKKYAVRSDCKAHSKTCGTREYKCDCGSAFSRRDSFITHRAFCDALADDENNKSSSMNNNSSNPPLNIPALPELMIPTPTGPAAAASAVGPASAAIPDDHLFNYRHGYPFGFGHKPGISPTAGLVGPATTIPAPSLFYLPGAVAAAPGAHMSATALLQKAAQMGAAASGSTQGHRHQQMAGPHNGSGGSNGDATMTVDFLGVGGAGPRGLMDQLQFEGAVRVGHHGLQQPQQQRLRRISPDDPHGQNAVDRTIMWGNV